ncbi:MAG TPA: mercuric reductase [Candidatus Kapabacteria bacterium]|jgi:pyruvate/2-oxoglutarate dehydrogenase complex dihydrolipoamide dehydrogenase (E3) component|nr:mercuric reductase [Candidatus Kapabacteria bacterium]
MTHPFFDAIIIGSGQAGTPLTTALAKAGWKTALIEQAHYGGTCINEGCTPTKTLIASARVAQVVRRAAEFGIHTSMPSIDLPAIVRRKDELVRSWSEGDRRRLEKTENVTLFFGHARFTDAHTIEISTAEGLQTIEGKTIFINTGGRPAPPNFPGADSIPVLNSTTVMDLTELPEHLLIIGGGYSGLEFGQLFCRLGSRVTIIDANDKFLSHEDRDIADAVRKVLEAEGITFSLGAKVTAARTSSNMFEVETSDGVTHRCSHVLFTGGRVPNSDDLGLDRAGIERNERGFIRVNPKLETNVNGIYALGDVTGSPAFTHISYDDFRIVRDNLLHGANRTTEGRLVPRVTFIDPQLGRIGLSESEAQAQGIAHRVAAMPMSRVARATETGETQGLMKAIVGADDKILGAAVFGTQGGEIMAMIEIAMIAGLTTRALKDAIFAHPTLAESLNNLFT